MTALATPAAAEDPTEPKQVDRDALVMMLSYIESECRRLGAVDAARHTAMAAALLPEHLRGTFGVTVSLQ
ncbi:hypothetical protein ACFOD4_03080 [Pseudoroseomonas globiformis]|uniref:Uncharacterized protein n=1 Tax=Teichococcus globiformis TaxID=2307229 RepID=A0ABV7FUJ0_9PROT